MKNPEPNVTARAQTGHPLHLIEGLPQTAIETLKARWLETAEQVLGTASSPEGRRGLRELLKLEEPQFDQFIKSLVNAVGDDAAKILSTPRPGGKRGLVISDEVKTRIDPV